MKKSTWRLYGLAAALGCGAILVGHHAGDPDTTGKADGAPSTTSSPQVATATATASHRRVEDSDASPRAASNLDQLLAEIAPPPPPTIPEVVEAQVADVGPKAAAESVRDDVVLLPAEQQARIEEISRIWSINNPAETWEWIVEQLEDENGDHDFIQSAISGYVESVAMVDPEAAVNAADLLDPVTSPPDESVPAGSAVAVSADPGFPGDPGFLTRNRK